MQNIVHLEFGVLDGCIYIGHQIKNFSVSSIKLIFHLCDKYSIICVKLPANKKFMGLTHLIKPVQ